jgi:hypothetical protein
MTKMNFKIQRAKLFFFGKVSWAFYFGIMGDFVFSDNLFFLII